MINKQREEDTEKKTLYMEAKTLQKVKMCTKGHRFLNYLHLIIKLFYLTQMLTQCWFIVMEVY